MFYLCVCILNHLTDLCIIPIGMMTQDHYRDETLYPTCIMYTSPYPTIYVLCLPAQHDIYVYMLCRGLDVELPPRGPGWDVLICDF